MGWVVGGGGGGEGGRGAYLQELMVLQMQA